MEKTADKSLAEETTPCPRCGKPLMNAAELGWCQACGYCRSLDDTVIRTLALASQESAPAAHTAPAVYYAGAAVSRIPWWLIVLVIGVLAVAGLSIWRGRHLPTSGLPRALWTTIQ